MEGEKVDEKEEPNGEGEERTLGFSKSWGKILSKNEGNVRLGGKRRSVGELSDGT